MPRKKVKKKNKKQLQDSLVLTNFVYAAVVAAVLSELDKKNKKTTLKAFLCGQYYLALLPTGLGKSLVKYCGVWWLTTGQRHVANVTPNTNRKLRA